MNRRSRRIALASLLDCASEIAEAVAEALAALADEARPPKRKVRRYRKAHNIRILGKHGD